MAPKRSGGGGGGGGKKQKYTSRHGPAAHELGPGIRGALITSDVHLEREAIKETYRLFETVLDAAAPDKSDAASASTSAAGTQSAGTAGDALAAELAALQGEAGDGESKKPAPRLSIAQTECKGNVFVRLDKSVNLDPVELVDRVMEGARAGAAGGRAPHVVRMLPVQCTCSARTPEAIAEAVAPLLAKAFAGFKGSYAVVWRRRCNNEVDKMKTIDALAEAVKAVAPEATVDLKAPQAAVVAEVIKTTCSLSVLPRWGEFAGYNLRAVAGGSADAAPAAQPAQTKAADAGKADGGESGDKAAEGPATTE